VFFIIAAFLAAIVNAAIIGSKAANASHQEIRYTHYRRRLADVRHYLSIRQVDAAIIRSLEEYHIYVYTHDTVIYDSHMPRVRSDHLRRELYAELLGGIRKFCFPIATTELSDGFFFEMAQLMKPAVFLPRHVIVTAGDVGERFYMIHAGECQVVLPGSGRHVFLSRSHFFGELAVLLPKQTRTASVVALGPVQTFYLERSAWVRLLGLYPSVRPVVLNAFLERALRRYPDAVELLESAKAARVLKIETLVDANVRRSTTGARVTADV
jgi:CRP-like cAMP-binding protein